MTDKLGIVNLARPVALGVFIPKQIAVLRDGVNISVPARQDVLVTLPTTTTDELGIGNLTGSVACAVFIPKQIAILRDGINDSAPAGKDALKTLPTAVTDGLWAGKDKADNLHQDDQAQ